VGTARAANPIHDEFIEFIEFIVTFKQLVIRRFGLSFHRHHHDLPPQWRK
jgi:hypothetical protein